MYLRQGDITVENATYKIIFSKKFSVTYLGVLTFIEYQEHLNLSFLNGEIVRRNGQMGDKHRIVD